MSPHKPSDVTWPPLEAEVESPAADDMMARLRLRATLTSQATTNQIRPVKRQLGGGWTARLRYLVGPRQALVLLAALAVLAVGAVIGAWWQGRGPADVDGQAMPGLVLTPAIAEAESTVTARHAGVGAGPAADPSAADAGAGTGSGAGQVAQSSSAGTVVEPDIDPSDVTVDVAGAVARPGVVQLAVGARVDDAVRAAGGAIAAADTSLINLARPLSDGEQVYVPRVGETPPPLAVAQVSAIGGSAAGAASPATALVDLNQADSVGLQTLPGIGPVLADRIIEHRNTNGPFSDVETLSQVSGIGPALMSRLRDLVTV